MIMNMKQNIWFEARTDTADGSFTASAIGIGIHTQGETLEELRQNILDAVECYFDSNVPVAIHLNLS